jgi:membrane protease YdiL (CAAX protease family)
MGLNIYETIGMLFEYEVLPPIPRERLYESAYRHVQDYFVVPAIGLLLVAGKFPLLQSLDPRESLRSWKSALGAQGLAARYGLARDAAHGFALFLFILVAYVASLLLVTGALRGVQGGDESAVFDNLTPLLIVLLAGAAGLSDEFLFRGIMLGWLSRVAPLSVAIAVQAALFGLVHAGYGTWTHVLGPAIFGLGMAWVRLRLGLVPAILLHALVNVVAFSLDLAERKPEVLAFIAVVLAFNLAAATWVRGDPFRIMFGREPKHARAVND